MPDLGNQNLKFSKRILIFQLKWKTALINQLNQQLRFYLIMEKRKFILLNGRFFGVNLFCLVVFPDSEKEKFMG